LGERGTKHVAILFSSGHRCCSSPPRRSLVFLLARPPHLQNFHKHSGAHHTPAPNQIAPGFPSTCSSIAPFHSTHAQAQSGHAEKPAAPRSCSRPPTQLAGSLAPCPGQARKRLALYPLFIYQMFLLESINQCLPHSTIALHLIVRLTKTLKLPCSQV